MSHSAIRALIIVLSLLVLGCSGGTSGSGTSVGVSNARVYGTITYEDREYGSTGFTNTIIIKPVRGVLVEAVDANTGIAAGSCVSNSTGGFDISFGNPSGNRFYLRAVAATASPGGPDIRVYSSTLISSVIGPEFTLTSGQSLNQDIAVSASGPMGGAFNILDVMASASAYINSLEGAYPSATLKVFWRQFGVKNYLGDTLGTYYCYGKMTTVCPYGEGIYVISGAPKTDDTDEYDDDVLFHEFSHYVGRYLSREDSPGGFHALNQNDQDPRLSWAEGWGDHMPGAIKKWLAADAARAVALSNAPTLPLTRYVDTKGASSSLMSFDFDNPGGFPYYYSTSEVAVAALMAALENSVGTQAVWDAYTSFSATPFTLEAFWDGYLTLKNPTGADLTALENIFTARQVNYKWDAYESDGVIASARPAVLNTGEDHTLYDTHTSLDTDYIAVNATAGKTLVIETCCPTNAADTFLTLYDSVYNTITTNDDSSATDPECAMNKYSAFSSKIQYSIAITNTYYIGVSSAPGAGTTDTGRYGSYRLRINSQ